jgi:hypothetical protein
VDLTNTGSGTGKTYITTTSDDMAANITNIKMDFSVNADGQIFEGDISSRIGWNLGFHGRTYDGGLYYMSDTVIEPLTIRYIYLAIE